MRGLPNSASASYTSGGAWSHADLLDRCLEDGPPATLLAADQRDRLATYLTELLKYNAHTNVYSTSAYDKLPFHVHDSVTLGLLIADAATPDSALLDLGSGSGLPSLPVAAVCPHLPVFAIESKSRKTRFLERAALAMRLSRYMPLTCNVREFCRTHYCDADFVTAKAFKPLPEVAPIAAACIGAKATLHVPVSEAQVCELKLAEHSLRRVGGSFIYHRQVVSASRVTDGRSKVSLSSTFSSL